MADNEKPKQAEQNQKPENNDIPAEDEGIWKIIVWLFLVILVIAAIPWLMMQDIERPEKPTEISYSVFRQQLKAGSVERVIIEEGRIQGTLKAPAQKEISENEAVEYTRFVTYLPSFGDESLLPLLEEQAVELITKPETELPWGTILVNILPFLVLIGFGYFFFSRFRGQGRDVSAMRQSGARLYDRSRERTTFADVAGARGAKIELEEIIEFLKAPEQFQRLGGKMPKGVLLVGPPGTGKTLLARAVAGEAEVPFFSISGSDFMEMFVGVGASRVRGLFNEAKKIAPSIIFIDELDSVGRRRGAGLGGGHDEREQTLNQLLSELDGFETNENIIVMAATNRPDILDPALLRPGRFDRLITVDLPTMLDRVDILKLHAANKPLAAGVDLEQIARTTPGFSGADLKNLLNEAALLAARQHKSAIEWADIEAARDKILMGLKRENLALTKAELELLAYHEAGHALIAALLPHADPIHKVTIVPRGRAMGMTQQLPERDRYLYSRDYMLDRLAVMMGGRAAEDLIFGTATSGAEDDLKQATHLARKMALDWGMSERLGHVALGGGQEHVFLGDEIARRREYSETTAREVDEEIKAILEEAYNRAMDTLRQERARLEQVAGALLKKEEISGAELLKLMGLGGALNDNNDHSNNGEARPVWRKNGRSKENMAKIKEDV